MTSPPRLAVLASGQGTNLRALLDADRLGGSIVLVLSDKPDAGALAIARARGIEAEALEYRHGNESPWLERLRQARVDTVLLAGFMRILGPDFLAAYPGRILNIHPSLLPAFPGVGSIARALEHGVRVTGCTVHLVDAGIDEGPILGQSAVEVREDDTLEALTARVHRAEHALYARTVHEFLTRPFAIEGRRVTWR